MNVQDITLTQSLQEVSPLENEPQPILEVEIEEQSALTGEVPDLSPLMLPKNIFTRLTEPGPFLPERVEAIVNAVRYGDQLTEEQRNQAQALVAEFADVFVLSVREVKPVDFVNF